MTVLRLLLLIAISAILLHIAIDPLKRRSAEHYERCQQLASRHASLGAEYRKNSGGDPGMLRIAGWHEQMRCEFEKAAEHADWPMPRSRPFPPNGWVAPADDVARQ